MTSYFKGFKLKSLLAIFLKFTEACFELILPLLMVSLIDQGILMNNQYHVYKMALIMVLLTVFGYLASITCQYYASVIAQRVGGRIRVDYMNTLLHLPKWVKDQFEDSSLVIRGTSDIDRIIDMIARTIRLAVRAPMIIFGSVAAMMVLNKNLGLILLAMIPIFVLVIGTFMMLSLRVYKESQSSWDRFSYKITEYLQGIRIIFAFNKAEDEARVMNEYNAELATKMDKMAFVNSLSSPLVSFMMNVLLVGLVYLGARYVDAGIMQQSQILALINYCTQIVLTLIVFMNLVMIFSKGIGSWGRVKEVIDLKVSESDLEEVIETPMTLEVKDFDFSYNNEERLVLKDINFKLGPGQRLGVIGLTGSGKSTLLKCIAGIYAGNQGSVMINNKDMNVYKPQNVRKMIAYVAQKPQFISGTIKETISLDESVDASHYLKLAQGEDILVKGLDAPVSKGGQNFSGGQRQRLSIARQLAKQPSLILFDDSFSALDSITKNNLKNTLSHEFNSMSQIIASQRTQVLQDLDRILVLDQGRIVASGTHEELLESSDLYIKIHQLDQVEVSS